MDGCRLRCSIFAYVCNVNSSLFDHILALSQRTRRTAWTMAADRWAFMPHRTTTRHNPGLSITALRALTGQLFVHNISRSMSDKAAGV